MVAELPRRAADANVDILETRLASQGYATLTARDGEAALAVARVERPDLILLIS